MFLRLVKKSKTFSAFIGPVPYSKYNIVSNVLIRVYLHYLSSPYRLYMLLTYDEPFIARIEFDSTIWKVVKPVPVRNIDNIVKNFHNIVNIIDGEVIARLLVKGIDILKGYTINIVNILKNVRTGIKEIDKILRHQIIEIENKRQQYKIETLGN